MDRNKMQRRDFLKNLGFVGIGSSLFTLSTPKGSHAAYHADTGYTRSMQTMGTVATITVFGEKEPKAREAVKAAFEEITLISDMMTTHRELSMLSQVNKMAGSELKQVDSRIIDVMWAAMRWGDQSGGVFDVTVLPLLKAYGFRDESRHADMEAVERAKESIGYKQIAIEGDSVGLRCKGAGIDFGGIAKGYAVDRAASVLRDKFDIKNAIVDGGGDLYVIGKPVDAAGWKVGLQDPTKKDICATFELSNQAIATSGNYNTKGYAEGREYGDKINPFTGEPQAHFLSTTVCAPNCMDADAASVTFFCSGRSASEGMIKQGISCLHIQQGVGGYEFIASQNLPAYKRV